MLLGLNVLLPCIPVSVCIIQPNSYIYTFPKSNSGLYISPCPHQIKRILWTLSVSFHWLSTDTWIYFHQFHFFPLYPWPKCVQNAYAPFFPLLNWHFQLLSLATDELSMRVGQMLAGLMHVTLVSFPSVESHDFLISFSTTGKRVGFFFLLNAGCIQS